MGSRISTVRAIATGLVVGALFAILAVAAVLQPILDHPPCTEDH